MTGDQVIGGACCLVSAMCCALAGVMAWFYAGNAQRGREMSQRRAVARAHQEADAARAAQVNHEARVAYAAQEQERAAAKRAERESARIESEANERRSADLYAPVLAEIATGSTPSIGLAPAGAALQRDERHVWSVSAWMSEDARSNAREGNALLVVSTKQLRLLSDDAAPLKIPFGRIRRVERRAAGFKLLLDWQTRPAIVVRLWTRAETDVAIALIELLRSAT